MNVSGIYNHKRIDKLTGVPHATVKTIDKSAAEQMPTRVAGKTKENETLMMLAVAFPLFSLLSSAIIHGVHALDAWP